MGLFEDPQRSYLKKIAIVGMSPTCDKAPWGDSSWEKWGLVWHDEYWARCDRLFEMHDLEYLKNCYPSEGYLEKLNEICVPLYMQKHYREVPLSIPYPFHLVPTKYFSSSVGYMTALAISEKPDVIGIWGVDMKDTKEHQYQRPNLEYLIGRAEGLGIEIYLPEESPVMKFESEIFTTRYGWIQ